jgi:hypothetical protein
VGGRSSIGKHTLVDRDDVRAAYPDYFAFDSIRR